jgi:hypothetical protein
MTTRWSAREGVLTRSARWAVCLLLAAGEPMPLQTTQDTTRVAVRFHHLHYRVADPGDALGEAATLLGGTRTIAQGLGVGVRVGREYVLFERESEASSRRPPPKPEEAYAEAVRWLSARGMTVVPGSLGESAVSRAVPAADFDHLAFAADDLPSALNAVREQPESLTEDAARFRLPSGNIVELVRDTDRPDAYWCPMHPDVRSSGAGKCPLCSMALVPIPAPRIGEYRLDVAAVPRAGGGVSGFRFVVRDPETGSPVRTLLDVHERPFHLFIVRQDLQQFAHVHPERNEDGSFEVRHDLDPGEYVLIADFLPAGGTSQIVQRAIVTPGYKGRLFAPPPDLVPGPSEQVVDGLRIRVDAPSPVTLRETSLRVEIAEAASGRAVTDIEPYLGASGHLLIVSNDLTLAMHGHPEGAPSSGAVLTFGPVFPAPGRYKLWLQFQRKGTIVTAPFVIEVPAR